MNNLGNWIERRKKKDRKKETGSQESMNNEMKTIESKSLYQDWCSVDSQKKGKNKVDSSVNDHFLSTCPMKF